jgi:hypothetical protein
MAIPKITDLKRYINRKLTGFDWNNNLQKIVNWFTDGTADISVNSLTTTDNVTIGGNLATTGSVTAASFIGDGSGLENLNQWRKNFIINGGCLIKNNADYTLVKDVYGISVDRFDGMATGTAVSAGILTQTTSAHCGTTGYGVIFSGVTTTGAGIVYLRHMLYNKNAVNFKNKVGSFSCQIYHNVGVSVPYTIYVNKATALNDFTSVSAISNSGGIGVNSGTATQLKFENVSFGDCSNGLEVLVKIECGAITLKNFEFTELQLEFGVTTTEFEYKNFNANVAENSQSLNGAFNRLSPDTIFESPATRYLSLSGANFVTSTAETYGITGAASVSSNDAIIYAAINLPNGAIITNIKSSYYNFTAGGRLQRIELVLKRNNSTLLYVSTEDISTSVLSTGGFNILNTSVTSLNILDNNTYSYYLQAAFLDKESGAYGISLRNVIITYTITQPLP